jgi:hypothetical protein
MNIAGVTIAGASIDHNVRRRAIAADAVNGQRLMVGSGSELERRALGESV